MQVNTTKQAVIARAVLTALTGQFALRTINALAQEAGCTESEAVTAAEALGCVVKRRRSDGARLYGISGRVNGRDEQHVPVTAWNHGSSFASEAAPSAADVGFELAKAKVVEALNDARWTSRSRSRLCTIANIDGDTLDDIIIEIDAYEADGYVTAAHRRCR